MDMELNTHDLIVSGNLIEALSHSVDKEEQELRLPLYLRLLSSSQNLSSITPISTSHDSNVHKELNGDDNWNQAYIDAIVELLERIIVRHSSTEDVDVLTNKLASKVSKSISKVRSLSKKSCLFSFKDGYLKDLATDNLDQELVLVKGVVATETSIGLSGWDTLKLELAGTKSNDDEYLSSSHNYTQSQDKMLSSELNEVDYGDEDGEEKDNDTMVTDNEMTKSAIETDTSSLKRKRQEDAKDIDEDTLFEAVQSTFIELIQLMSSSLKPLLIHVEQDSTPSNDRFHYMEEHEAKDDSISKSSNGSSNGVVLPINSDATLAETTLSSSLAVERDLSAIITALSSCIPAIRHEHLSSALCRSNIPQCAHIIKRLAANHPNTTHSLVRGCIHAFKIVSMSSDLEVHTKRSIMETCTASLRSIALLSNRECLHIVSELQVAEVMPGLMLNLLVNDSPDMVLSMVFADLVQSTVRKTKNTTNVLSQSPLFFRQHIRRKRSICGISRNEKHNSWIVESLKTDAEFRDQIENVLFQMIQTIQQNWIPGKACMILQVLGLYIHQLGSLIKADFLLTSFSELMGILNLRNPEPRGTSAIPCSDPDDNSLQVVFTTCFVICYTTIFLKPNCTEQFCEAIRNTLFIRSQKSKEFMASVEDMILNSSNNDLYRSSLGILTGKNYVLDPTKHIQSLIVKTVDAMKKNLTRPMGDIIDTFDVPTLLRASQGGCDHDFCIIVKALLRDANRCNLFYEQHGIEELLFQAVALLTKSDSQMIPAVLPLTIEMNCRYVVNCAEELKDDYQSRWRQLVLQLIYAFHFLEVNPKSPFSIHPIIFPVKWIVQKAYAEGTGPCEVLHALINKSCPYVRVQISDCCLVSSTTSKVESRAILKELTQAIHDILVGNRKFSQSVEALFLNCRGIMPYISVDTAVAKAMLSSNEEFCEFMTYHNLVCDPLILLKCNLKVWKHDSLRRIILVVLQRALLTNEALVLNSDISDSIAAEYFISRDTLIVHCFLALLSGAVMSNEEERISCQLILSMLSVILARRRGLISSIVKQGLPDTLIDWIVQYTDVSNESIYLFKMMESKSPNVVERLRIADFALSVAIFGSQDVSISTRLAYQAVSVLVYNFFFIIGPVGVPANIVHDDEGHDITQMCQNTMFRMLNTLTLLHGDRSDVKKETSHLLSRLVSMCKSETATAGLSGIRLQKRKLLLKKVYQSIAQINSCFGGGIQL